MKHRRLWGFRPVFAFFMAIAMLMAATVAYAEEAAGLSKSKTSSEYELTADNDTTEITLSLPSEEYLDTFDIVFVVDASNESQLWEPEAVELMDALLDEDLNVNIGVVKFKGRAQDTISAVSGTKYSGLTALSDDSRSCIEEAIRFNPDTDERSACGNGTNIHSALLLAEKWLDSSNTPADHKYVLLFTDGRAYIYDDGAGNPTAIYAQYHRGGIAINDRWQPYGGAPAIASTAQGDKYHATIPGNVLKEGDLRTEFLNRVVTFGTTDASAAEFQALLDSKNSELTGTSDFETTCYYVDSGADKVNTLCDVTKIEPLEFGTYFKSGATSYKYYYAVPDSLEDPFLEYSPLVIAYDEATDTYSYTGELNPNYWMFHVSSAEKALYLAGHTWLDLGEKYHTIAIPNDRGYNSGLETCRDFLAWLPENSELSAAVKDTAAVKALFDTLENQLIYAVGRAVVTDKIPEYLNLVEDAYDGVPFQVLLDGEELAATPIAGGAWGFGTPTDSTYPYEVRWDESSRTFTFYINVPVENAKPVVLNYKLQWNGEGEEEVDVDTNASTTIEYWPSNDPDGESTTEPYESPVVIYRSTTDYAVTKVWDDADNVDAIRPESIDVQLYADGEPSGEPIRLDEEHHWTYTWTGLFKFSDGDAIDYEVKEVETPDGYEVAIAEATDGTEATITNSHTPEVTTVSVTKTWDDADNQDGIRPTADEFAANMILSADGSDVTEQYADKMSVEDNEDGTYTITWTDLPKFAGSTTPINYEVEEVAIDGYVASITSNVDGTFAITNKHEPATIDINVTKTWDDVDDRDGIRPDTITVKLLADGKEVATAEFGEPEGWKYTFTDMPKYSEGKEIAYTIEEIEVEGYSSAVAGDATNGFVIANVHKSEPAPGTVDVTVVKVWDDKDDKDGIRPASVTVSIIANGAFTGVQLELSEANGWKATATGLPKSIDGKDATYTVEEDKVPEGYTATVKMDGTTFTVTNTHEPKKPDVPKTGDPTVLLPMVGVLGTLGVAAAYVLKGRSRKNR